LARRLPAPTSQGLYNRAQSKAQDGLGQTWLAMKAAMS